jgi:hypothetical protein
MNLKLFFESKVRKLDWVDVGLIKWSCIAFGIILAILIPTLTEISIWYFVGIAVILAIRPLYRVYIK